MRVLLVDDEPLMLKALTRLLTREGHEVATAGSAPEALGLAAGDRFDAALIDIMLPGRDGLWLACELERNPATAHIRRIFMTGALTHQAPEGAVVLMKPFSLAAVLAALQGV